MSNSTVILPKLNGADIELGNFVLGLPGFDTGSFAARLLLAEIEGLPRSGECYHSTCSTHSRDSCRGEGEEHQASGASTSRDWGRRFLPNGACAYIDLGHLELCIPEVTSAWDHLAAWHAMLRIARAALDAANAAMPDGRSIQVLVNNSDGHGHSYGSHLNFLITRQTWDNIIRRKPHYLGWLASFQVSSIVFTGQGKVGAENGAPPVDFQLSQRADYFQNLIGSQTTYDRPIVNSRDEAHCGRARFSGDPSAPARLHVIFFDNTLAHYSCLLKVGVMQLVLAMAEAGAVDPGLILDDPLGALRSFSHDVSLEARSRLASGEELTAVELQFRFLDAAQRFAAGGGFDAAVPRAAEILDNWGETLRLLQAGDWAELVPRLDWVMKRAILERVIEQRPGLTWQSPEIHHLDHIYASLGADGLYWAYEQAGFVKRLVDDERIDHFRREPPSDTRAWTRAMLLRAARPEWVDAVDWDSISFRVRDGGYWPWRRRIEMDHPMRLTAAETAEFFPSNGPFSDLLDAVEATAERNPATAANTTVN